MSPVLATKNTKCKTNPKLASLKGLQSLSSWADLNPHSCANMSWTAPPLTNARCDASIIMNGFQPSRRDWKWPNQASTPPPRSNGWPMSFDIRELPMTILLKLFSKCTLLMQKKTFILNNKICQLKKNLQNCGQFDTCQMAQSRLYLVTITNWHRYYNNGNRCKRITSAKINHWRIELLSTDLAEAVLLSAMSKAWMGLSGTLMEDPVLQYASRTAKSISSSPVGCRLIENLVSFLSERSCSWYWYSTVICFFFQVLGYLKSHATG